MNMGTHVGSTLVGTQNFPGVNRGSPWKSDLRQFEHTFQTKDIISKVCFKRKLTIRTYITNLGPFKLIQLHLKSSFSFFSCFPL